MGMYHWFDLNYCCSKIRQFRHWHKFKIVTREYTYSYVTYRYLPLHLQLAYNKYIHTLPLIYILIYNYWGLIVVINISYFWWCWLSIDNEWFSWDLHSMSFLWKIFCKVSQNISMARKTKQKYSTRLSCDYLLIHQYLLVPNYDSYRYLDLQYLVFPV